jgi:hypothetical protein
MLLLLTAFVVTLNGKQEQRQPGRLKVAGKGDEKNEKKEDRPPDEENIPFAMPRVSSKPLAIIWPSRKCPGIAFAPCCNISWRPVAIRFLT